jgi:hypothetical protein
MADDVGLDGAVIITDHGEDVHRRILGIKETPDEGAANASGVAS